MKKALRKGFAKVALKSIIIILCTFGFLLQTSQFIFLYWTYPTVVDIQVTVPPEIEVPGITFCSANGLNLASVCRIFFCSGAALQFTNLCGIYPEYCTKNNTLPPDIIGPKYSTLFRKNRMNSTLLMELRMPWEEFFECTITSGGGINKRPCDTSNIVHASYYSDTNTPNFCFSLNTRWGDPNRKIEKIKKSDKILLKFYMDISNRNRSAPEDLIQLPRYHILSSTSLQLAIHSQELTMSPYIFGKGFEGGRNYRIKLIKDERHLLPSPYQTNCTDYMKDWKKRGGLSPLNQVMAIQECKKNTTLKDLGCVPFTVDYPHNETICNYCPECDDMTRSGENCTNILHEYNQPCDSTIFKMNIEERWVYIHKQLGSFSMKKPEILVRRQKGHDCALHNMFKKQCQIVNIELDFDDFEVTNMTYNPKFETLELFSVVGGYMGMYLGVSLAAMYDFFEKVLRRTYAALRRYRRKHSHKTRKVAIGEIRQTHNYKYNMY